jgi:hypothetical protein
MGEMVYIFSFTSLIEMFCIFFHKKRTILMEIEGFTWIVACSNTAYIFFLTVPFLSEHPDFPSRLQIFLREHTFGAILVSTLSREASIYDDRNLLRNSRTRNSSRCFLGSKPGSFCRQNTPLVFNSLDEFLLPLQTVFYTYYNERVSERLKRSANIILVFSRPAFQ